MPLDTAIAELKRLLSRDPSDTRALVRLAEQHVKGQRTVLACESYARAGEVLAEQGFARRALGAFAQAMECARAQPATHERVVPLASTMARLYQKEHLPLEALAALDQAARFLVDRGADAHAVRALHERLALADDDGARATLADALLRLGDTERALAELTTLFARFRANGARDEAIDAGEKVLLHRKDAAVSRTLAELYLARNRRGDPFLALAKLRLCCTSNPTHVPTLELLARAFEQARHPDKAARVRKEIDVLQGKVEPLPSLKPSADVPPPPPSRIDVGRPSFWSVPDAARTEDSAVSVSLADIELVGSRAPEASSPPPSSSSLLEAALEEVDALADQGRIEEASRLVARHLSVRPNNPLLLERKHELASLDPAQSETSGPSGSGPLELRV